MYALLTTVERFELIYRRFQNTPYKHSNNNNKLNVENTLELFLK